MLRYLVVMLLLPAVLFLAPSLQAREITLHLQQQDTGRLQLGGKPVPVAQVFDNAAAGYSWLRKLVPALQEQGYLAASVDTVWFADTALHAVVYRGSAYRWAKLSFTTLPAGLADNAGIRLRDWENEPVRPSRLAALSEQLLKYCEDNGYPFAYTTLGNIQRSEEGVSADFVLERGQRVRFDTLIIEGNVEVSREYLQRYLGIRQGDLYNEGQLRLVSKRLSELPFLQEAQPWRMDFTLLGNKLYLYLKEKKANQLNGLLGLQPNTLETGKFLLTADLLLGLKNALGFGESITATYQNLQYKSPRFHVDASLSYLLGTAFGLDGSFDLFKRDTTFRRTSFDAGLRYQFNASDYVKAGYQTYSNRLITADTTYAIRNKRLPENLDISNRGATIEFFMDRTDYRLNPRKGWQARVAAAGLLRQVIENDAISTLSDGSGFDYQTLYDSANAEKYQYRITGNLAWHFSPLKNTVVKLAYNGGYISGARLFQNELYQLGGFRLLRGFDEQSIYASQYQVLTLELRLLLDRNSYFYLFSDNAWIRTQYAAINEVDYPISFGTGITLENKSGIFNIALGVGKRGDAGFLFRQAKIHFGYTAYF